MKWICIPLLMLLMATGCMANEKAVVPTTESPSGIPPLNLDNIRDSKTGPTVTAPILESPKYYLPKKAILVFDDKKEVEVDLRQLYNQLAMTSAKARDNNRLLMCIVWERTKVGIFENIVKGLSAMNGKTMQENAAEAMPLAEKATTAKLGPKPTWIDALINTPLSQLRKAGEQSKPAPAKDDKKKPGKKPGK